MRAISRNISVVVMTQVGEQSRPRPDEHLALPEGFSWKFVPEAPFAIHIRSILCTRASAVAVAVGAGDAVDRAANLIARLLETGSPIVIAIAEAHGPLTESTLRNAGAFYLCAGEAEHRLGHVLESFLDPPARPSDLQAVGPTRKLRMDAG